jgi:hypothetical protein
MQGKSPKTITEEILNFCLSPDASSTAGIGTDNMTFLLVVFNSFSPNK